MTPAIKKMHNDSSEIFPLVKKQLDLGISGKKLPFFVSI